MPAKLLIVGPPNAGKTSLIKNCTDVFIFARDGKPYPFQQPHTNVPEFNSVEELIDLCKDKLKVYKEKFGGLPKTIVFDSVSRIFTEINSNCNTKYKGYDVWSNTDKEINKFVAFVNTLNNNGINIVLIAHAMYDVDSGKYVETCKGSFAKIGGFLSTVDYSIFIDIKGSKRIIYHRGKDLSRCLLSDTPDTEDPNNFSLQEYIDKINAVSNEVTEKWSL